MAALTATPLYTFAAVALTTGDTAIPETPVVGFANYLECLLTQVVGPSALWWANSASSVAIALELSYDGAKTWVSGGSSLHQGGSGSKLAAATQMGITGIRYTFNPNKISPSSVLNSVQLSPLGTPLEQMEYLAIPTHLSGTITVTNGPAILAGTISAY